MKRPMTIRPEAETDIRETFDYLESVRAGLGSQFSAHLRDVFQRIEVAPESCGMVWQDVRAVRVRKFQYVVYFVAFDDRVEVIAVLHGARRASVWRERKGMSE